MFVSVRFILAYTQVDGLMLGRISHGRPWIFKEINDRNLNSKMLLQVHDELIFEVPESELEVMKELVKRGMESVVEFDIPLKVEKLN